ncbi:MAG: DUF2062 domain-containing protein [Candidatus Delongbacteria bacterium]
MTGISESYRKRHQLYTRILRIIKYYFLLFVRKEDSPENIAHGFAIGIFIGFLPVIPFQTLFTLLICTIFKTNKLAGVIGSTAITNPFSAMPVFYAQHFLGRIFILNDFSYERFNQLFIHFSLSNINEVGKDIITMFKMVSIGGIILGIILYPVMYYISKTYIIKFRTRIREKKLKNKLLGEETGKKTL